jgi:Fe-S oxidoreductase
MKVAVGSCIKCQRCIGIVEETCPMHVEFGISPFSPPGIFRLAEGIFQGYIKMSRETSIVPFTCNMCGACAERCGSLLLYYSYEYPTKLIEGIRGMFVEAGEIPEHIAETLDNLYTTKNAWKLPKSKRVEWESGGEISVPDYTKERNEFLLFVGDASLIPETQHIPRVLAKLLQKGGVNFGTLKEEEVDSGNEAREMGETGLFEVLAQQNIEIFKQFSVRKIITISPHDYHTFRNDYPKLGMDIEGVYHYTQIISDLIREGKITMTKKIPKRVSFQDPCHLGRYNGIYEAPRDIIKAVPGVIFTEMSQNHDEAFCCGSGGGRMWYDDPQNKKQRIADVRVAHAKEVNVDIIATACPYCLATLQASGDLGDITIKDVGELVLESMSQ